MAAFAIGAAVLLLGAAIWAALTRKWLLAFGGLSLVIVAGAVWIVLLAQSVESTYIYAGTRHGMERVAQALRSHHDQAGALAKGLTVSDLGDPYLPAPSDGYGYVLEHSEHAFVLKSWARDGKPGGVRLDQDIIVSWKQGDGSIQVQSAPISP